MARNAEIKAYLLVLRFIQPFIGEEQSDRLQTFGAVVRGPVDKRTEGVGFHLGGGVRGEESRQALKVFQVHIQPLLIVLRLQYHRHTIVNRFHELIRFGGEDGRRAPVPKTRGQSPGF